MTEKRVMSNFIDGEFVPVTDGRTSDVVNPATGEVYATAPLSGPVDIDRAFRAAQRVFDEVWRDTTPSERQNYMLRMAESPSPANS